ncbi:hypothetical protein ADL00_40510 [Streptomyces sp. AS58]|uniref:hypothetical protein n=1 Tax=Streptomyces sp. AS58 TaxID=1519489 RepID=UPI0006AED2F6|nr:hypothetical protein [Streptomyces sp. AS58]KOV51432.1 hypothetical protein ADL00_40510 [Streptomyces sp. AS58]
MTVHVDTSGLPLGMHGLRARTLRALWGEMESTYRVVQQHPSVRHSLLMWLRPGTRPPRSLWRQFLHKYVSLRVVSLGGQPPRHHG